MTQATGIRASRTSRGGLRGWLAGFRRITTSGNYIPEIDGLRFIAIAVVVLHHIAINVCDLAHRDEGLFELGTRGVELFFAISGFVLAAPYASQYLCRGPRVKLGRYFLRRITRLEPPYLLALLILFLIKLMSDSRDSTRLFYALAASTAYLHTVLFGSASTVMGVAWSLEIEVQFYILMPVLALVFLIRAGWARRGILLGSMLAVVLIQPITLRPLLEGVKWDEHPTDQIVVTMAVTTVPWQRHIGNYIQFFLAGILLADIYVVTWKSKPASRLWGDIVWLLGWPLLFWTLTMQSDHVLARLAFPLLILILYVALFQSTIARRAMSLPVIATMGGMCYSIYLLHNAAIQLTGDALRRVLVGLPFAMQMLIALLVMIPVVLLVCGLFFRLIERPCMKRDWPKRVWNMFFVESPPAPNSK